MSNVLFVPRGQTICLSSGDKHFLHTWEGGTNISHTQEGGGDKHFSHTGGGTNIFTWGQQKFYVEGIGGYDDVDEEMDVSEANIFVSEVSKLSAGARSFMGP